MIIWICIDFDCRVGRVFEAHRTVPKLLVGLEDSAHRTVPKLLVGLEDSAHPTRLDLYRAST
jgi:hypothetical protein